jgi:GNAT superfamily N-acetyltransferase
MGEGATDPVIRFATGDDLGALHALIESAYRGDSARSGWTHEADLLDGQRTDMAALSAVLDDPWSRIIIAADADVIIGCVHIAAKGDGLAALGMLAVDPDGHQARGLGRELIAAAENWAMSDFGCSVMEMTVIGRRAELIAYYVRRGYAPTGEMRPFPRADARFGLPRADNLDFVVLTKPLVRAGPSTAVA